MPSEPFGSECTQSSLPLSRSYARTFRSGPVPRKIRPPAVTSGAFRGYWAPVPFGMLNSGGASTSPVVMRHLMSPVFRSYYTISDQAATADITPPGNATVMNSTGDRELERSAD